MSMDADAAARFADRRARVLDALGDRAAMVLPAAPELRVGRDTELRYRVDAELYYLTGYTEPEAVAVLCPASEGSPFTLFVRPRDPERELWTGERGGTDAATGRFGADAAFPIAELDERLPKLLAEVDAIHYRLGAGPDALDDLMRAIFARARGRRPRSGRGPRSLVDPGAILDDMRLIKDEHEIERMREAAQITVEAFREAARSIHAGAGEWEIEAALEAGFRRQGADGPAFPSIVASGDRAAVLHYVRNACALPPDGLVLLDAGASHRHYAADVSRTFPVSGRFSAEQRSLYDAVVAARDAAIAAVRPGATTDDVHRAAVRVLVDALLEHGLLHGDAEELAGDDLAYKPFFPHKTSHWIGLEVHDVGDYARDGEPRPLRPGMVLTVEPGLYIPDAETPPPPTAADAAEAAEVDRGAEEGDAGPHPAWLTIPPALRGIGIRVEDDVLVTPDGHEVITAALPADADAVEGMIGRPEAW